MKKIFSLISMIFVGLALSACGSNTKTYTVEFDTDGGSTINSQEVIENGLVNRPTDPTKTDYRFSEWQLNSQTYDFSTQVTTDFTLKAVYKSTSSGSEDLNYTVSFITNNDTTLTSVSVTSTDLLTAPTVTKDGYTLFGWQIVGSNNYFNFETDYVSSNITLEAIWEAIPSIDVNSLDVFISEIYESNKTYTDRYIEIYNPKTTEVDLTGYKIKSAYNNATLEASTRVLDLTGYTLAAKSCLIIYDEKGSISLINSFMTSNITTSSIIIHDADDRYGLYKDDVLIDIVEQISDDHSAKDSRMVRNYEFGGNEVFDASEWSVLSASDENALNSSGIHKLLSTEIDPIVYTVTFDTNGGSELATLKLVPNSVLNITPPSRTGYELVGWEANGGAYDITLPITSNITIKAIWEQLGLDSIELDVFFSEIYESDSSNNDRYIEIFNPTEYDIDLSNYVIGMAYNANTPSATSRTISLDGYVISPYSTIVIYDDAMNKELVAQINGIKFSDANILHDGNDNYGLFKDGVLIDMLGDLTETNYHQNKSLRRNVEMYGHQTFNINEWTDYTANTDSGLSDAGYHYFRDLPTYTVTFDTGAGTNIDDVVVITGQMLVLPTAPTLDGYKFVCWMIDDQTEFDSTTLIKSNYTLTAKWEEFIGDMYTVTFNTGDANVVINPQNVYAGDKVICPYPPFYEGYNLVCWTTADDKGFDFDTIITSNITLTAAWEAKVFYTVTFETDGTEVDPIIVEDGYTISEPITTKFGYTFNEWQLNYSEFSFTTAITSDITLVATWNQIVYNPEVITVNSVSALSTAISTATPGDTIIMEDGTYEMTSSFNINSSGTDFGLLTIEAQTVGGVVFTNQANIIIKGDYVVFSGFTFKDGSAKSGGYVIEVHGSHNRITNVEIDAYDTATNKSGYITVKDTAKYAEVDNCTFINKSSAGVLLLIDKYSDDAMYAHVHHNYFYNYTNPDPDSLDNELETMRIGWSGHSQTACYTVVEYNIFESISSETELISVKSGYNVIRNNLILNCSSAITLRHGNTCLIENNVILNDDIEDGNGIRVFDAYHVIRNNYISGSNDQDSSFYAALVLHNGGNKEGQENGSLNGQWTTNNVLIEGNTFVNNEVNIAIGDKNYSNNPWDITFKNNFVYADGYDAIRMYNTVEKVTFENEYYYASGLGITTTPTGVNYFIDLTLANTTTQDNGLITHELSGASGLYVMTYDEVGTKYSITQAVGMSKSDYINYFNDWPFDLV